MAREDSAAEPSESAAAAAKAKITKIHKTLCNQNENKGKRIFALSLFKFGPLMLSYYLQSISFCFLNIVVAVVIGFELILLRSRS